MSAVDDAEAETYNPWTVVNLVFSHLAEQGLHPVLGESGDPGPPAHALLLALGIQPAPEGNREVCAPCTQTWPRSAPSCSSRSDARLIRRPHHPLARRLMELTGTTRCKECP